MRVAFSRIRNYVYIFKKESRLKEFSFYKEETEARIKIITRRNKNGSSWMENIKSKKFGDLKTKENTKRK